MNKPYPKKILWYGEPNLGSHFDQKEISAVTKALKNSKHWFEGFGPNPKEVNDFEKKFEKKFKAKNSLAVANNGVGFDIFLDVLNLKKKDEIIIPSINFKAWQMSILKRKIKTIFCDVDYPSLNMDIEDLKRKITKNTKIVCPVHFTGEACKMREISNIVKHFERKFKKKIYIISDAARAVGAVCNGKNISEYGDATIFSFNGQKIITTLGEGGIISFKDKKFKTKIINARSYGGENGWGLNYKLPKISAVFGLCQLDKVNKILKRRRKIFKIRNKRFSKINDLILPDEDQIDSSSCYVYNIILKKNWKRKHRDEVINLIRKKYKILNTFPKFINYRWPILKNYYGLPNLKKSSFVFSNSIILFMHPYMTPAQEEYTCSTFEKSIYSIKKKFSI